VPEPEKPLVDERRRIGPNDVRVTQAADGHWVVSKFPIGMADPAWPGSTFSSRDGSCPDGPDLEAMLDWVRAQPWSRSTR
jgi:hypothetical protein